MITTNYKPILLTIHDNFALVLTNKEPAIRSACQPPEIVTFFLDASMKSFLRFVRSKSTLAFLIHLLMKLGMCLMADVRGVC